MNTASLISITSSQEALKSHKKRLSPLPSCSSLAEEFFAVNADQNHLRYAFNDESIKTHTVNGKQFISVPVLHIFQRPVPKFGDGIGILLENGEVYVEKKTSVVASAQSLVFLTTENIFSSVLVGRGWTTEPAIIVPQASIPWVLENIERLKHLHFIEVSSWEEAMRSIADLAFRQPTAHLKTWIYSPLADLLPKATLLTEQGRSFKKQQSVEQWLAMTPLEYKMEEQIRKTESAVSSSKFLFDILGRKLLISKWKLPPNDLLKIKGHVAKARHKIKNCAIQPGLLYQGFSQVIDFVNVSPDRTLAFEENGFSCCIRTSDLANYTGEMFISTSSFNFPCSDHYSTAHPFLKAQLDSLIYLPSVLDPLQLGKGIVGVASRFNNYEKGEEKLKQAFTAFLYEKLEVFLEPKPADLVLLYNLVGKMNYDFKQVLTSGVRGDLNYYPGYGYGAQRVGKIFKDFEKATVIELISELSNHPLLHLSQGVIPLERSYDWLGTITELLNPAKQ